MSLYTLKTSASLSSLSSPAGLTIEESANADLLSAMGNTTVEDVQKRIANDHTAFIAYMNRVPAAFGWMAKGKARIGELNHEFILPVRNRYLWNFRTMEAFRGLGIYPALLQFIIHAEQEKADRFWIIHAPENHASLRGIQKAGFEAVGRLYYGRHGASLAATSIPGEDKALVTEMDIAFSQDQPASCWNCSSPYLKKRKKTCCCAAVSNECTGNKLHSLVS